MPLATCPDCRQPVSDAAPACIHCGRPSPAVRRAPGPVPRRRHPLAGTDAADAAAPRAVLRSAAIGVVIVLLAGSWVLGGPEGRGDLLSGLASLAIGVSLLLLPVPREPARTPGARRADWGEWFGRQEARRELHWNRVAGWVFVAVGAAYLLIEAL